jgi:ATPase family associated with various cellular activities (AAA)
MMVIVEGPDGSGKTTLCKKLCEDLELDYMRYSGLDSIKGPQDAGIIEWWDGHIADETEAVFDRCFYISERLYQPVTRGRELIATPDQMTTGLHDLWVANPVLIFCITNWETEEPIIMGQGRPGLAGVDLKGFEKVHWGYWGEYALWLEAIDHVFHYDYRKPHNYEVILGKLA